MTLSQTRQQTDRRYFVSLEAALVNIYDETELFLVDAANKLEQTTIDVDKSVGYSENFWVVTDSFLSEFKKYGDGIKFKDYATAMKAIQLQSKVDEFAKYEECMKLIDSTFNSFIEKEKLEKELGM